MTAAASRRPLRLFAAGGGVLEHPAYSAAWPAHGLNAPPSGGGWVNADDAGGWTCHVEQGRYGHPARKATWLFAHGVALPSLRWGRQRGRSQVLVSKCGNHVSANETRRRLSSREASSTPVEFRDALIDMARTAQPRA